MVEGDLENVAPRLKGAARAAREPLDGQEQASAIPPAAQGLQGPLGPSLASSSSSWHSLRLAHHREAARLALAGTVLDPGPEAPPRRLSPALADLVEKYRQDPGAAVRALQATPKTT